MLGRFLVGLFLTCAFVVGTAAALGVEVAGLEAIRRDPQLGTPATLEDVAAAHDALFGRIARGRGVDWQAAHADLAAVRALASLYARSGPSSGTPGFETPGELTAYRVDAYHAFVVLGVAEHFDTDGRRMSSVHDRHGLIDPSPGFGFYRALFFVLDGGLTTLDDLAGQLFALEDARMIALLHDGSRSSPPMPSRALRADTLEAELEAAAHRFASEAPYVVVDDGARTITLDDRYQAHAVTFANHAHALGEIASLMSWVRHYASPAMAASLERAERDGYRVEYAPHDWTLSEAD